MAREFLAADWSEVKQFVQDRNASLHFIERPTNYELIAFDGIFSFVLTLSRDPEDATDLNDFETNFKPTANQPLHNFDFDLSSGPRRLRVTTAPGNSGSSGGPLAWSNKLRYVDMNENNGGIPRDTKITDSNFSTVFKYNGKGILSRFVIKVDDIDDWFLRLIIDGEDIFEDPSGSSGTNGISTDDIMDEYELEDDDHQIFGLSADNKRSIIFIAPNEGIRYESSVEIQLKSDNSSQEDFRAGLVVLSKEE